MLVRRIRRGPRRNHHLVPWPRWMQAWREDRERHATVRAAIRAHAPIRPGERLLAVACGAGGDVLAATDWALYHQIGQAWARLGWEQVNRADWDDQRHVLVFTGLTPSVPACTVLPLARDWGMPAVAFERVSWAKVVDQRVALNTQAGARVIARRLPGGPPITWLVILDHGLDPEDPAVRTGRASALTALRAVTGVDGSAGFGLGIT